MVFVCDTSSCHDDHLCQIIFKSHYALQLWVGHEQISLKSMHKVRVQTVTMTFKLAIWFLFATHCLVMMIICAKSFLNLTMHYKVMGRTRTGFTEVYAQSLSADCDLDL